MANPPPDEPADSRSTLAIAYTWAWRVIAIALEMVVPGLVGYWIDVRLGTKAVFVILGFVIGVAVGIYHLIHIAKDASGFRK